MFRGCCGPHGTKRAEKSHHRRCRRSGRSCRRSPARLGHDGHRVRPARGRGSGLARRRAGYARERAARSRHDGRTDRRHRARRRLGLRARCRLGCPGLAAGQGRGFQVREALVPIVPATICSICSAAVTRIGAAIRPIASWDMPPPASRPPTPSRSARPARDRRRRSRSGGEARLGVRPDPWRHRGRSARRGQCRRQHRDRWRPALLGRRL